jgi:hypothetical protein
VNHKPIDVRRCVGHGCDYFDIIALRGLTNGEFVDLPFDSADARKIAIGNMSNSHGDSPFGLVAIARTL